MIGFLTLFLGLVTGQQPVGVAVQGAVATVELTLDGRPAGRISGPPWWSQVDFGELSPHELVARSLDAEGKEIALARQWLNLPRPPAEVEILLERNASGRPVAVRLAWQSLVAALPEETLVSFDGKPLKVTDPRRIELPAHDPHMPHLISAELRFGSEVTARADVVLRAGSEGEASTELTAVPVRFRGSKPPATERLQALFVRGSEPLRVIAVEQGPARAFVVRDLAVAKASEKLRPTTRLGMISSGRAVPPAFGDDARYDMTLRKDDRVRIVWPTARRVEAGMTANLFDSSGDFRGRDAGFPWLLSRVSFTPPQPSPLRFADAVAVAGLEALALAGPRAVVYVLPETMTDASRHTPEAVRRYLERIRVPLFVWSFTDPREIPEAAAWGDVQEISTREKLRSAVKRLRHELEAQHIVWLEGKHLPHQIAVAPGTDLLEIVR